VRIGAGGELIVGGFDPSSRADAEKSAAELERNMPSLKSLGVTSHECYVRWNLCEVEPGKFDWSVYDRYLEIYKKNNIKWVPFLICGSAYSVPDWYYKKPGSQGYVCLEHGQESDVQSLWNPKMREHVARFVKAFCDHYVPTGTIESILLGVTGNYGEAIYIASGNDWTAGPHGNYHTHAGFWAGDRFAVESFRAWLGKKYGRDTKLGEAWGSKSARIDQVNPFLRAGAPNDRAWIDFVDWYTESMTDYARFWLGETRKNFEGEIYLCTGGHAPPEHGADFGEQCRIAAEIKGGVRITNEGSDYGLNFAHTRWVASAGRQYGAYFSFEPAGEVRPNAVVARVYNATASGARGLHFYWPNLFGSNVATENFVRTGAEFKQRKPVTEIAVYYPSTDIKLNGQHILERARHLRDRFDFDFKSDQQILDGGLKDTKALVLLFGTTFEKRVWDEIAKWVRGGGVLVWGESVGKPRTVEGDASLIDSLLVKPASGTVFAQSGSGDDTAYRDFIASSLASCDKLSPPTRRMVSSDGKEDGAFVTLCDGELLWLNVTDRAISKSIALPAHAIVSEPLK
jgi:hypothetical protein